MNEESADDVINSLMKGAWDESKHKRDANGEFGAGGGEAKPDAGHKAGGGAHTFPASAADDAKMNPPKSRAEHFANARNQMLDFVRNRMHASRDIGTGDMMALTTKAKAFKNPKDGYNWLASQVKPAASKFGYGPEFKALHSKLSKPGKAIKVVRSGDLAKSDGDES
jgi:hypothetical protein